MFPDVLLYDLLALAPLPSNPLPSRTWAVATMAEIESTKSAGSAVPEKEGALSTAVDVGQATVDLEKIKHAHQFDPNLPQEKLEFINKALHDGDAGEIIEADALFADDSPYDEVRAAVRATDSGGAANTVRALL